MQTTTRLKKSLPLLLIILFATSCLKRREPMRHETGVVIEKQYTPELNADGMGINSNGELSYHSLQASERFTIVFKCEHDVVFSVNKMPLYTKLNRGDTVDISYYELINIHDEVMDYDLIDANKLTQ
jgi:hypothetical protein